MNKISIRILIRSVSTVLLACLMFDQVSSQSLFDQYKTSLKAGEKVELSEFKGKTIGTLFDKMGKDYDAETFYCIGDRVDFNIFNFYYHVSDSTYLKLKISNSGLDYLLEQDLWHYTLPVEKDYIRLEIIYDAKIYCEVSDRNIISNLLENEMITRNRILTMFIQQQIGDTILAKEFKHLKEFKINELRMINLFNKSVGLSLKELTERIGKPDFYLIEKNSMSKSTWIEFRYKYDDNFSILIFLIIQKKSIEEQDDKSINQLMECPIIELYVSPIPNTLRDDLVPYKE